MQTLSAYLFETDTLDAKSLSERRSKVLHEIETWLSSKKVEDPSAEEGSFRSRTPGFPDGSFVRETVEAGGGYLQQITLTEASSRSQNVETRINVIVWDGKVTIYVNVNTYNTTTILAPANIIPRCPKIVQSLLQLPENWLLNQEPAPLGVAQTRRGEVGGQYVGDELRSSTRAAPIILISQYDNKPFWPTLAKDLAADLAGLAHVIEIDDEAAEVVEADVGRRHRCFGGAVRLFWPKDFRDSDRMQSELWTVRHLDELDQDGFGKERFRDIIRQRIMDVAALAVTAPRAIRLIQNAAANEFIDDLRSRQSSAPDAETMQIVELYAHQNEALRRELEEAKDSLAKKSAKYSALQYAYQNRDDTRPGEEVDDDAPDLPAQSPPKVGDVRIVKKLSGFSGPYDRMMEWGGCNHSSWETIGNAPKALKGLQRLYKDNPEFKRIEKCLSCTGGGVWRVTW